MRPKATHGIMHLKLQYYAATRPKTRVLRALKLQWSHELSGGVVFAVLARLMRDAALTDWLFDCVRERLKQQHKRNHSPHCTKKI